MNSDTNPSEQYWKQRAAKRMALTHIKGDKAIETLQKSYLKAYYEIDQDIKKIYKRYKKNGDLSDSEALQFLNSEIDEKERRILTATLANTKDENLRKYLLSRLDSAPYKARITRKQAIRDSIYIKLKQLGMEELHISKEVYVDTIKESYYRHLFDMQKGFGMAFDVAAIDDTTVNALLNKPFLGQDFSQRIWSNTDVLTEHLYNVVVSGLVTGKAIEDMTKELSDRMAMGLNASKRLIRTELTYYNNQAEILSYKEADVKKYIFMAIFDLKTSRVCRELDNKVFKVSEAKPGVNLPPMHPWCRSTTVGYFKDYDRVGRRAKDPKTGESYILPKDMSYNEWYDKYVVEKHGKEEIDKLEKIQKNKSKDKAQYNKYKEVLGKDSPKTLKDFQEIKYNNRNDWNNLKQSYLTRKNTINEVAVSIDSENIKYKIGDKTPKGRELTEHGAQRCNERGFTDTVIDKIIDNNKKRRVKEIDPIDGSLQWRYQDNRGNTVITNEDGSNIVTVYSHPRSKNNGKYIPK